MQQTKKNAHLYEQPLRLPQVRRARLPCAIRATARVARTNAF